MSCNKNQSASDGLMSHEEDSTIRFSVSLPENLLRTLDEKIIQRGYSSRSEFIRDLIREKIVQDTWASPDAEVVGVLTMVYDHHKKELSERMLDIQHNNLLHILVNTHIHLDHNNCLETIMIRGKAKEIEKIALLISGLNGVKFADLTRTSVL
jgi:CopG family transcriptional regulator, nickel-responsive regulator